MRFEVQSRRHKLICDQPAESGGTDEGMTPPELLLAALGTCSLYYAVEFLKARQLGVAGVAVTVKAEKAASPARLSRFVVEVETPELTLEAKYREGLLRAVNKCLIHNTLTHEAEIVVELADQEVEGR
jgi:uncharacterized OsmC-like protein